nr:hypothetical protein [Nannocystis sp.]
MAVDLQAGVEAAGEGGGVVDGDEAAHRQDRGDAELADDRSTEAAEAVLAGLDAALAGGEEDEVGQAAGEQAEATDELVLLDHVDTAFGLLEEEQGLARLGAGAAVGDDVEDRVAVAGQCLAQAVEGGRADRAEDRAEHVAGDAGEAVAGCGCGCVGGEGGEAVGREAVGAGDEHEGSQVAAPQLAVLAIDGAGDVAGVAEALVEGEEAEARAGGAAQALPQQWSQLAGVDREQQVERRGAGDGADEGVADRPAQEGVAEVGAVGGRVDQRAQLGVVDAHAAGDHGGDGARPILEHRLDRVGVVDPRLDRDQERSAKRVGVASRQRPMISQAAAGPVAAVCKVVARKYALHGATELRELEAGELAAEVA